jgi:hypothetical protein
VCVCIVYTYIECECKCECNTCMVYEDFARFGCGVFMRREV